MADAAPAPAADPIAAAQRIVRFKQPRVAALRVSTEETIAMAQRLLALDDVATTAYRLLATLDALEGARSAQLSSRSLRRLGCAGAAQLTQCALALTEHLASALVALGYDTTEEEISDGAEESEDGSAEPAGAAE